jgi:diadenosine tetraphosphate (Ap4A) HIT family hydrolase
MKRFNGDKLNIGALGNMVPQLHIHHIVRHEDDSAWPHAVWGRGTAKAYSDIGVKQMRATISGLGLQGYIPAP